MRGCLSLCIVEKMKAGIPVKQACIQALDEHVQRLARSRYTANDISVIAMDCCGNTAAATNREAFPYVVCDDTGVNLYVCTKDGSVFIPDEEWLKSYKGD